MRFHKYHALGNDYIVLDPRDFPSWQPAPTIEQIRVVCHRNYGVGSDGILWGPLPSKVRKRAHAEFGIERNVQQSALTAGGGADAIFLWSPKLAAAPEGLAPWAVKLGLGDMTPLRAWRWKNGDPTDDPLAAMPLAPIAAPPLGSNAPPPPAHNGPAYWIKVSAQTDGTFTVTNARNGFAKTYRANPPAGAN